VQGSLAAISDGKLPTDSNDHSIPRFTWWDRKGSHEWVQYDFRKPREVSGVQVYWFDDRPRGGGCRVPESWEVHYLAGREWKPVVGASEYGTQRDQYNQVDVPARADNGPSSGGAAPGAFLQRRVVLASAAGAAGAKTAPKHQTTGCVAESNGSSPASGATRPATNTCSSVSTQRWLGATRPTIRCGPNCTWTPPVLRRAARLAPHRDMLQRVVFAKHFLMGGSHYAYTEGQSDAQHERHFRPGSALCMMHLDGLFATVSNLIEDSHGVIRDPDVSYEGDRVLFAWKNRIKSTITTCTN
jgi:hypothetical protein